MIRRTTSHVRVAGSGVLIAALLACAAPVLGAVSWIGGDGAWEDGANWSSGAEPTATDDVTLVHAGLVGSSDLLNEALSLIADTSLLVASGLLDVLGLATNLGSITIAGGGFEANTLSNDATGSVLVTGAGSALTVVLEFDNRGGLTVADAGTVFAAALFNRDAVAAGSGGRIHVETLVNEIGAALAIQDAASRLDADDNITNAGDFGVRDGGELSAASFANYAALTVDEGTFTADSLLNAVLGTIDLSGPSALFTVNGNITNQGILQARLGARGSIVSIGNERTIEVTGGAVLDVISVLNETDGTIRVRDPDSRMALSHNLRNLGAVDVGDAASLGASSISNAGDFTVRNAATVDAASLLNMAAGLVTVVDPGSLLALANHFQNDGGVAASAQGAIASGSFVNAGDASLEDGATLTSMTLVNAAAGRLGVAGPGTALTATGVMENRGRLEITGGATATADGFGQFDGETLLDDATLSSTGSPAELFGGAFRGSGTVTGGLIVHPAASVAPGTIADPTRTLAVQGPVELGGTLAIELLGTGIADFDWITATGPVALGGTLEVSLLDGFLPIVGDAFDIILGLAVTGGFDQTLFPVFAGRTFTVVNGVDFLRLEVAAVPIPGAIYLLVSGVVLLLRRAVRGQRLNRVMQNVASTAGCEAPRSERRVLSSR